MVDLIFLQQDHMMTTIQYVYSAFYAISLILLIIAITILLSVRWVTDFNLITAMNIKSILSLFLDTIISFQLIKLLYICTTPHSWNKRNDEILRLKMEKTITLTGFEGGTKFFFFLILLILSLIPYYAFSIHSEYRISTTDMSSIFFLISVSYFCISRKPKYFEFSRIFFIRIVSGVWVYNTFECFYWKRGKQLSLELAKIKRSWCPLVLTLATRIFFTVEG